MKFQTLTIENPGDPVHVTAEQADAIGVLSWHWTKPTPRGPSRLVAPCLRLHVEHLPDGSQRIARMDCHGLRLLDRPVDAGDTTEGRVSLQRRDYRAFVSERTFVLPGGRRRKIPVLIACLPSKEN